MTSQAQDTVAKVSDPSVIARAVYLNAVMDFLHGPTPAARDKVLAAFATTPVSDADMQADVRSKVGRMLGNLVTHDVNAWARFLSIHVGFTDQTSFATFKDLSPFATWIVVEQDLLGTAPPSVITRGECTRYIAAMHGSADTEVRSIPISTHVDRSDPKYPEGKRVDRSFIAVRTIRT